MTFIKIGRCLALAVLILGAAGSLNASVIASSTFDTNDEGWMNGNFDGTTGSPTSVNYFSTGGNPAGQIQVYDNYYWNAFLAPAAFLGNQSAAYLGTLTFDIYDNYTDSSLEPAVMISDGTNFLYSPLLLDSSVQGPTWHSLSVQFLASTGWTNSLYGGSPVSEALMQSVLAVHEVEDLSNTNAIASSDHRRLVKLKLINGE